ncbi:relaxase domain-containing protein [Acinetobacter nosocomialis]|uniref:MobF family relaxase n=1 Tax=Acinetobacter calcoaceticus/baumannii complex TaxID=909768 RepID=UPI001AE38025|nr:MULTISPECIES: MobF family relaxase [Acinetobacter calcoaceticus/baumannii complex]MBP1504702.1 relaxase domain-containing protein [Acinetobacter nosocomialis]MDV4236568.1 relaxase domain-containing protein [Acinetobacter baumannii]
MMSFKSISNSEQAVEYYESLATEDYYELGGEPSGYWVGQLQSTLYLNGEVSSGELVKMLQGYHPISGEALASNAGPDHKGGWDMTFSAPKSVSVIWALADQETRTAIQTAQKNSVEAGIKFLEQHAFSSRDRGENSGSIHHIIAAAYEHSTSRTQDPHLHTHVLVANLGLRVDSSVCAIDFDARWKQATGAVYRAELSHQLQRLGFQIEPEVNKSFSIKGIPKDLCDAFSKRRNAIVEQAEKYGVTSAQGMQIATFATRGKKADEISRFVLFQQWQAEAASLGYASDLVQQCQSFQSMENSLLNPMEIFGELHQQMSTFTPQQLYYAVAVASQGHLRAEGVNQYVNKILYDPELVQLQTINQKLDRGLDQTELRFTTQTQLALEKHLLDKAKKRQHETQHQIVADPLLIEHANLSREQKVALEHITTQIGGVKIIQGMAGTGKGYLLGVAHLAWENVGLDVRGATLAAKAAQGLQESTQIPSQTLHSLIHQLNTGKTELTSKTVLVIDEAGMVGSRQLTQILDHAEQAQAKVVLVGDHQQLQPIDAGGAFRLLAKNLGYASLQNIQRQKTLEDRKIVMQLATGQSEQALAAMRKQGNLHVQTTQEKAIENLIEDWWQAKTKEPSASALMLAGTRSDLYRLNQAARLKMNRSGQLGASCEVETVLNNVHSFREFAVGDQILFCKNQRRLGITNGDVGILKKIQINQDGHWQFQVEREDSKIVEFSLTDDENIKSAYTAIDHAYAISVHKAQGMTVDHAFVLSSDTMIDREWSYVAASRAREKTHFYCSAEIETVMEVNMGRSRQKDTSLDYTVSSKAQHQLEL